METTEIADQINEIRKNQQIEIKEMRKNEQIERYVAVYIGFVAMLLALTSLGGANATKDTLNNAIAANDTYGFYQAKSIRQHTYRIAADELEILLSLDGLNPEVQKRLEKMIDRYRSTANRYESDPEKGEGKKELMAKAKEFESKRDHGATQDPYFDLAEAGFQIAVVLASVSMVTEVTALLWISGLLTFFSTILMVNGYFLFFAIPGL